MEVFADSIKCISSKWFLRMTMCDEGNTLLDHGFVAFILIFILLL